MLHFTALTTNCLSYQTALIIALFMQSELHVEQAMNEHEIFLFQAFYFFPSSMTAAFDAQKNIPLSYITQIQAFKRKLLEKIYCGSSSSLDGITA